QIAARANQAGLQLNVNDIFERPTIAQLASLLETTSGVEGPEENHSESRLSPIQSWFFEQQFENPHHYNQSVLLKPRAWLDRVSLLRSIDALIYRHEILRTLYRHEGGEWSPRRSELRASDCCSTVDISALPASARERALLEATSGAQASLDVSNGPVLRALN